MYLFNESIEQGIFLTAWKKALIITLKEVAVPSSPSDFRPISLLCFLSKVLEKLAHDQIVEYFRGSEALDPLQTGFKKHQSTQTALLKLTDDIHMGRDKQLLTILLQFNFSKAFDTISPSQLLRKLKDLGFCRSALLWIYSYVTGRSQCVISNSNTSEPRETNLGVPQGSVLGPLLFCLYINDLKHLLNIAAVYRLLYADDLQIYIQVPFDCLQEGLDALTAAAERVSAWAETNGLRLNASKTKAIIFGSKHAVKQVKALNLPGISMGGEVIPFSDEVLSLGVVLQNTLSWKSQIANITRKVNKALFGLRFIRACTTQTLPKNLGGGINRTAP